jgi:hypothetical protein
MLRCVLKVDDQRQWNSREWVAVFFTSGWGGIKALHYYHTPEFFRANAADFIVKKTADIARRSGAIWAFAITDNDTMLEPMKNITAATGVFRDFYVNGIIGKKLGVGGSVYRHFSHAAEVISTVPLKHERMRQSAGHYQKTDPLVAATATNNVSEAEYHLVEEEENMPNNGDTEEHRLSQKQHWALVEFLSECGNRYDTDQFDTFYNDITGIWEFQFLKNHVPRRGEDSWSRYHAKLNAQYKTELHRYHERFPDLPYPEPSSRPLLLEDGERVPRTPADFLEAAGTVSTVEEYQAVCAEFPSFDKGIVKAVSPQKIALFHERAALPLLLEDNTPENWARLYTKANDNGIAVNNFIPDPADIERLGLGVINAAREHWKNVRSQQWQLEEYRRTCAQDQRSPDPTTLVKDFYAHPYAAGTLVPTFFLQEENGLKIYAGFSFKARGDDGRSITLARKSPEGKEKSVAVSESLYKTMIANAKTCLEKPETTPEVLRNYDRMIAADAEETRPNTAVNFWHNYKILCRLQASNPQEAMDVTKAVVRQMPKQEQEKFKRTIKAYEKAALKLVSNPLLRPLVKPQETYTQRILNYYEENVKDLPIKDTSVHGPDALAVIRQGVTSRDVPGQAIDPALHLKIGDTVKLSLEYKILFGENRKRLPITSFTVVAASEDLNKIVLLDKTGNSKYTLAKDTFCEKMRKLERKLEKRQHKRDVFESIRY